MSTYPTTSNVDKLRFAYKEWGDSRGESVQTWMDLLADDVEIRSIGDGIEGMEFAAARRGKPAVENYFAELGRSWEMISYTAHEFIAEGDRVVMVGRCSWRFRATGKTAESPTMHVWRFRDGKATELLEFYDTARAFAAVKPD